MSRLVTIRLGVFSTVWWQVPPRLPWRGGAPFQLASSDGAFDGDCIAAVAKPSTRDHLELPPPVKRMDVIERGIFANNNFLFLCAALLMNRYRHSIPIDFDQESSQFEVVIQCFV